MRINYLKVLSILGTAIVLKSVLLTKSASMSQCLLRPAMVCMHALNSL